MTRRRKLEYCGFKFTPEEQRRAQRWAERYYSLQHAHIADAILGYMAGHRAAKRDSRNG